MSSPKVTLIGKKGNTYSIVYGQRIFEFTAGIKKRVPVVIAIEAGKKRDRKGNLMFKVEGMPEVIEKASPVEIVPTLPSPDTPGQQQFGI